MMATNPWDVVRLAAVFKKAGGLAENGVKTSVNAPALVDAAVCATGL